MKQFMLFISMMMAVPVVAAPLDWVLPELAIRVTENRVGMPPSSRESFQQKGISTLGDALAAYPSLHWIDQGGMATLYANGLPPQYLAVEWDGISLMDPIEVTGRPRLDSVLLQAMDSMVVVGPLDAMMAGNPAPGGVLQINSIHRLGTRMMVKTGSGLSQWGIQHGVVGDRWSIDWRSHAMIDRRISATNWSGQGDIDGIELANHRVLIRYDQTRSRWTGTVLYTQGVTMADTMFGNSVGYHLRTQSLRWGLTGELDLSDGMVMGIRMNQSELTRQDSNDMNLSPSDYGGRVWRTDWFIRTTHETFQWLVGVDTQSETGHTPYQDTGSLSSGAGYMGVSTQWGMTQLTSTVRLLRDTQYDWRVIGAGGVSHALSNELTMNLQFSNGIRNPSIYETLNRSVSSAFYPERSSSIRFGGNFKTEWGRGGIFATRSQLLDRIQYNTQTWKYESVEGAYISDQVEVSWVFPRLGNSRETHVLYTRTMATQRGEVVPRVPEWKWSVGTGFDWGDWEVATQMSGIGPRLDAGQRLEEAWLGSIGLRYLGWDHWVPSIGVMNVLNTVYQPALGYHSPPITWQIGLEWHDE